MKASKRKLACLMASMIFVVGGVSPAWASEGQGIIVAERSFQQISRAVPLVAMADSSSDESPVSNVQLANSVEEQNALMGIGDGSPLNFEIDSAEIAESLHLKTTDLSEMRSTIKSESVTGESIRVLPDIDYSPFSLSATRTQEFIIEMNESSLLYFVLGKRVSSNKKDAVHVVLSAEDGRVNSEWDVDQEIEANDYGGFYLDKGIWTIRLSTSGNAADMRFYYLTKAVPHEDAYETEPNSSTEAADDVPLNRIFHGMTYDPAGEMYMFGSVMPIIDVDILRFTLSEVSRVEIDLATSGKLTYQVYNESGEPLRVNASNDESDPYLAGVTPANKENGRQIECGVLPAGMYYLHIVGMDSDVWKKSYKLSILADASEEPDPGPGIEEKRIVRIDVKDGHGTVLPAPGCHEVTKVESFTVEFLPKAGYELRELRVNGVLQPEAAGSTSWNLPPSDEDQVVEVLYALIDDGSDMPNTESNDFKDISKTILYIDGTPETASPEVVYEDAAANPHILAVHHNGPGTFRRLYPESFNLKEMAVYHYKSAVSNFTEVYAFEANAQNCIKSFECTFPFEWMADQFVTKVRNSNLAAEYLDGWSNGNAAYIQQRLPSNSRADCDRALRELYDNDINKLVLGPDGERDYKVTFENNGKTGIAFVNVTGQEPFYGSKRAAFSIVERKTNGGQPSDTSSTFADINKSLIYVNGVPSNQTPKVSLVDGKAEPVITVLHHFGASGFNRLAPEGFNLRETAVYHFKADDTEYTRTVAIGSGEKRSIISDECRFREPWMAQMFVDKMKKELSSLVLDCWSDGRIAFIQYEMPSGTRETFDDLMKSQYGQPENELLIGPNKSTDYTVSFRDNTSPGTATVMVAGRGSFYGSATAQFIVVGNNESNMGAAIGGQTSVQSSKNTSTTAPLTRTGISTTGQGSSGKTGLVQTGDIAKCGTVMLMAVVAAIGILAMRKRKLAILAPTVASATGASTSISCESEKPVLSTLDTVVPKLSESVASTFVDPRVLMSTASSADAPNEKICDLICSLDDLFGRSVAKNQ